MAKAQTFSEKVAKAQSAGERVKCPVCGAPMNFVKVISPVKTPAGHFRFRAAVEKICKCSNTELMVK